MQSQDAQRHRRETKRPFRSIDLTILKFLRAGGDMLTPETQLRDDVRLAEFPSAHGRRDQ